MMNLFFMLYMYAVVYDKRFERGTFQHFFASESSIFYTPLIGQYMHRMNCDGCNAQSCCGAKCNAVMDIRSFSPNLIQIATVVVSFHYAGAVLFTFFIFFPKPLLISDHDLNNVLKHLCWDTCKESLKNYVISVHIYLRLENAG